VWVAGNVAGVTAGVMQAAASSVIAAAAINADLTARTLTARSPRHSQPPTVCRTMAGTTRSQTARGSSWPVRSSVSSLASGISFAGAGLKVVRRPGVRVRRLPGAHF
jgi:hypothetical protein